MGTRYLGHYISRKEAFLTPDQIAKIDKIDKIDKMDKMDKIDKIR